MTSLPRRLCSIFPFATGSKTGQPCKILVAAGRMHAFKVECCLSRHVGVSIRLLQKESLRTWSMHQLCQPAKTTRYQVVSSGTLAGRIWLSWPHFLLYRGAQTIIANTNSGSDHSAPRTASTCTLVQYITFTLLTVRAVQVR